MEWEGVPWVGSRVSVMSEWFPPKERVNSPGKSQKSQPSKKLAPFLSSTNFQSEVRVGTGPPAEEVGVGLLELELEEPEVMEETMTPFPPPDGVGVDDVGFCSTGPVGLATQYTRFPVSGPMIGCSIRTLLRTDLMSLANLALLLTAAWWIRFAVLEMSVASDDEADSRQRAR